MADCHEALGRLAAAAPDALDEILELNRRNVELLSELNAAGLSRLISQSFHATLVGQGEAFLIAFDQSADYDSPNFRWFRERYPQFVYVDRVAVADAARGRGLASCLYGDLFGAADAAGHSIIACEINIDPPKPISDAFHQVHGFEEVGRASLSNGKSVRYLVRLLVEAEQVRG